MRIREALWGLVLVGFGGGAPAYAEGVTASDALKDILAGNETFQKNETLAKRRAATAQSQSPQAIVLSCSDSRVPPEAVFNRYLGRLFIVRTAGHAVGDFEYASIEYAVEHLHTPLLVVLGHERCGAIKATVEAVQGGGAGHGDEDADHGHKKSHRADRSPVGEEGQRAGACAPAKQAHDAEDDAEDGDDEPAARPEKAKTAKKAKSDKKKKFTSRARPVEAPAEAHDAADEDDEDDRPARAKRTKGRGPADAERDAPAEDDEAAAEAEETAAPAPAHGKGHGATEHISSLVAELEAPVRAALEGKPVDPVDAAVRVNTQWVAKRLVDESGVIREAVEAGKLRIVGARYDLDTGAVEILE